MSKAYIPLTEENKKAILNFIGMCRMNGLEGPAGPSFNYKDIREGFGTVSIDLYYDSRGVTEQCWKITVRTDTEERFHDDEPSKKGETYCYRDAYTIDTGSLDIKLKSSNLNYVKIF